MNKKIINAGPARASKIALCFLMFLTLAVVGSAAALPVNKLPYGIAGPTIQITGPTAYQAQLSSETLVASIIYEPGYAPPGINWEEYPHIIMAIYENGTLIWSNDPIKGGPPYHMAKVSTKSVQEFEKKVFSAGLFKATYDNYCQLDAPFVAIYFKGPDGYMELRSSHEPFEKNNPGAVEAESGYRFRNKESKKYQAFRARWSGVKRSLLDLISPKDADGISTVTIQTGSFLIEPARVTGSNKRGRIEIPRHM